MITVHQNIGGLRPAYNDDFFIVSSSNVTQDNFLFLAHLYVNGTDVATIKVPPHPTYARGLFNPKRIVENYVSHDFDTTTNNFATNDNSWATYQLRFGESYGATSSGTTDYPNMASGDTVYVFNGICDYEDLVSYSSGDYIQNASTVHFLTNKPETGLDVTTGDLDYMYGVTFTSGDIYYLRVDTYNTAGTLLDTYWIYNQYQAANTNAKKFFRVGCGPKNLNNLTAGVDYTSLNGGATIVDANVSYYYVQARKFNGTRTSQQYKYNVVDVCTKTETARFHFLNKKGGYDGFAFKSKTKHGAEIKRDIYKKDLGAWRSVSSYTQLATDRADVQYNTNIKDNYTAVSDWITEDECLWLEELFTSPDVYVMNGTNAIPVNIKTNKYDIKMEGNEKLFNLTIEYDLSYDRYRQRY